MRPVSLLERRQVDAGASPAHAQRGAPVPLQTLRVRFHYQSQLRETRQVRRWKWVGLVVVVVCWVVHFGS